MPSVTIPLAGQPNTRHQTQLSDQTGAIRSVDQRFKNCDFDVVKNPITGDAKMYIQKRWGLSSYTSTGSSGAGTALLVSVTGDILVSFKIGAADLYINSTSVGPIDYHALHITEASISGKQYYFITSANNEGWYLVSDSYAQTAYTGNRTSGSPVISSIASTAGMYAGQAITGDAGIPAGTRILSVDSGTQITLTANATSGAGTSTALTKTPVAKFIDSDFPSAIVGKFVFLDGYLFIMDQTNKRIYQSGLNNISSWAASDYITVQSSGEQTAGIARVGNRIAALCAGSIEFFYNAGNPSGSVLTSQKELFRRIGVSGGSATDSSSSVPVYAYSADTVYFLGTEGGQSRGVYAMSGTQITKISTPEIDRQISRSGISVYWLISAFHDRGKNYVVVSENTSPNMAFMFCDVGGWSEFTFLNSRVVFSGGVTSYTGTSSTDTSMVFMVSGASAANGIVYRLRNDVYADNGTAINLSCQTSKTDFGSEKLKTIKNVALLGADIQSDFYYLSLDGSNGCYASTPDSAALSITGNIDIYIHAALDDWTPSSTQSLISKYETGNASWAVRITTGGLIQFVMSTTGSDTPNDTSSVATGFTNGARGWIRVYRTSADGVTTFYTSPDGSTWNTLGTTKVISAGSSIYDSTAKVMIGAEESSGTSNKAIGKVYYAQVRNSSGVSVCEFGRDGDLSEGATSITGSYSGEVWTINGTASIVDDQVAILEYSDDDYENWTTAGRFKLKTPNPRIYRCGSFKGGRAWRLTHSANTAFRAQALKFEYEEGAH